MSVVIHRVIVVHLFRIMVERQEHVLSWGLVRTKRRTNKPQEVAWEYESSNEYKKIMIPYFQ